MQTYTRNCKGCNEIIHHKDKYSRNYSESNGRLCSSCARKIRFDKADATDGFIKFAQKGAVTGSANPFYGKTHTKATKEKIRNRDKSYMQTKEYKNKVSANSVGSKNPMHGKTFYDIWLLKYGKLEADLRLEAYKVKKRIQNTGSSNPMFGKPSPQGSGNGWSGWYKGVFFRSLKELSYMVMLDESGTVWQSAESIKIPYEMDGMPKTYHPDFLVNRTLVEIKPTRLRSSKIVQLKEVAAMQYCLEQNLEYKVIDPEPLSNEKIKALRDTNQIKFLDRYEKMYQVRYSSMRAK